MDGGGEKLSDNTSDKDKLAERQNLKRKKHHKKNIKARQEIDRTVKKTKKKGSSVTEKFVKKKQKSKRSNPVKEDESKVASLNKPDDYCDMSAWKDLCVPEEVLSALAQSQFTAPTPIQALVLPTAIRDRKDIIGAAETGSGKTLAFGIPMIHHILRIKQEQVADKKEEPVTNQQEEPEVINLAEHLGDIEDVFEDQDDLAYLGHKGSADDDNCDLTPTHEDLDELVEEGIGCVYVENNVTFDWSDEETEEKKSEKRTQKPLYALVLCPTRELALQVRDHLIAAAKYTDIKIAAIVGGMAVQKQTRLLRKAPEVVVATPGRLWELVEEGEAHLKQIDKIKILVIDEADRMVEKGHFQELSKLLGQINSDPVNKKQRQTFVFSATLTFAPSGVKTGVANYKKKELTTEKKLESLMKNVGIKAKPKVIDLTKKGTCTAETLVETRINCSLEEKDIYLYYFLKQYPGRTLVFTNSKDCIRRLVSIFVLLETCPLPLHADMHQKQRLKNLDKFKGNPRGLLIATDVAARGLDIPNIQHVIHYQVPRTIENYVHRSGRTARAHNEGLSVMLVSPNDQHNYRKVCKMLNEDEHLPVFPVEQDYMPAVKARVALARIIDKQEYQVVKISKKNSWFEKAAREMDMEVDEDVLYEDEGDSRQQAETRNKIHNLKLQLKTLLKQPLLSSRYSGKYITQMGKLSLPYLKESMMEDALQVVRDDKKIRKQIHNVPTGVKRLKKTKYKKKKKH